MNMLFRKSCRATLLIVPLALMLQGQNPRDPLPGIDDPRLPNGKSQKEEILKAEHQNSLEDAAKLIELTEQVKQELEKNDRHVVALGTLKKLDEIEKLSKRIRARLKRY